VSDDPRYRAAIAAKNKRSICRVQGPLGEGGEGKIYKK